MFTVTPRLVQQFRDDMGWQNFRNWLVRIVIDEAKSMLQDERDLKEFLCDESGEDSEQLYLAGILDAWRHISPVAPRDAKLRETLRSAPKSLPGRYRAVMALRDIAHLSVRDTAEVLGLTQENIKTRLSRAQLRICNTLAGRLGLLSNTGKGAT